MDTFTANIFPEKTKIKKWIQITLLQIKKNLNTVQMPIYKNKSSK